MNLPVASNHGTEFWTPSLPHLFSLTHYLQIEISCHHLQFPIQNSVWWRWSKSWEKWKVDASTEACLRRYTRLLLNQFIRPDFNLVCYHLMCRSASCTIELIKWRSSYQVALEHRGTSHHVPYIFIHLYTDTAAKSFTCLLLDLKTTHLHIIQLVVEVILQCIS